MILSDTGESRVRGYLYIFERSMRATHPRELADDAVREVESHIRERVAEAQPLPTERDALERILGQLGAPATVARGYSLELLMDEAETGGRLAPVLRSLFHIAATGIVGFFGALGLFVGYVIGGSFILVAAMKPVFPANVGFWIHGGLPTFGAQFPAPGGGAPMGGYWIVPIALAVGALVLLGTHRLARRWIGSMRARMAVTRSQ
jgi:uncharacterized membrane protein